MAKFKLNDKLVLRKDHGAFEIQGIHPAGSAGRSQTGYVVQGIGRLTLDESEVLELFDPMVFDEVVEPDAAPEKEEVVVAPTDVVEKKPVKKATKKTNKPTGGTKT